MTTKNAGEKIMLLITLGFIGATAIATVFTLGVMFLTAWVDHADAVAERNQQTYCTWPEGGYFRRGINGLVSEGDEQEYLQTFYQLENL